MMKKACCATCRFWLRSGPDMSKLTIRPPPMPRPNSEGWKVRPKVPGSLRRVFWMIGISSPARFGSTAAAPTMVIVLRATKKKREICGGPRDAAGSSFSPSLTMIWSSRPGGLCALPRTTPSPPAV